MIKIDSRYLIPVLLIVVITIWIFSGLFQDNSTNSNGNENTRKVIPILDVRSIKSEEKILSYKLYGYLNSEQEVDLKSEIGGRVLKIFAKEGQNKNKGDKLFILDGSNLLQELDSAKSNVAKTKLKYDAYLSLYENKDKYVSNIELTSALSELQAAESRLKMAADNLEKATIIMPFDGFINMISVQEGDTISPFTNILAKVTGIDQYYVESSIPEKYISSIQINNKTNIYNINGDKFFGHVSEIATVADAQTHAYPIKIYLDNDQNFDQLRLGMSAKIDLFLGKYNGFYIPFSAVSLDGNSNAIGIKVADDDHIVHYLKSSIEDEDKSGYWISILDDEYKNKRNLNLILYGHQYINIDTKIDFKN